VAKYSVWRGEVELGVFNELGPVLDDRTNRFVGAVGWLAPTTTLRELGSISQHREWFGRRLTQSPRQPLVWGQNRNKSFSFAPIYAQSEDEKVELPLELVLSIRDEKGRVVPTDSIDLRQTSVAPGTPAAGFERSFGLNEERREVWHVTYRNTTGRIREYLQLFRTAPVGALMFFLHRLIRRRPRRRTARTDSRF